MKITIIEDDKRHPPKILWQREFFGQSLIPPIPRVGEWVLVSGEPYKVARIQHRFSQDCIEGIDIEVV